jgi:hypothetical protein
VSHEPGLRVEGLRLLETQDVEVELAVVFGHGAYGRVGPNRGHVEELDRTRVSQNLAADRVDKRVELGSVAKDWLIDRTIRIAVPRLDLQGGERECGGKT